MARSRAARRQRLAVEQDLATVAAVDAVDRAEQLAAAGADEPRDAEHLPRVQVEAGRLHVGEALQVAHLEQDAAAAGGPLREQLLEGGADHVRDELVGRRAGREPRHHGRPLPQHRDPVADAADLVEPVRDVDDADALGGEPADDVEERLDLALVEDGGGLVHDEQTHLVGQRPGDRHDLLAGRPEVAHAGVGGDRLVADALEQGGGLAAHAGSIEEPALAELVAEEDVVGDAQVGDQVELLVDRGHASADRRRRVAHGQAARRRAGPRRRSGRRHRRCT